jgi:DNA polymerase-3 subunit alpha
MGMITQVKIHLTSKGDKMAFLTLDTLEGPLEVTVFSDLYAEKSGLLQQDMIVLIAAKVTVRREAGLVADRVVPVEEAERHFARGIHIRLLPQDAERVRLDKLAETLGGMKGDCDVYLHCVGAEGGEVLVHASEACRVKASRALRYAVEEQLGENRVWFSSGEGLPSHRPPAEPKRDEPRWKRKQVQD